MGAMRKRMIWNDIRGNRLMSVSTWFFMAVSAFLFALTAYLAVSLLGSVDALMEQAKTPDFLQMHNGELDKEKLQAFAGEQKAVREYQVLTFLNMENAMIELNGHSLSDSTQDNGICVQSGSFDYLLDMENHVIEASDGEIYVPVCYRQEYDLKEGGKAKIGEETFLIAGFLRDSQMNSMMSSSKRFLVSVADYERLKTMGSEEYLIEFLLDGNAGDFATAYTDAGLPANGPAVTKPLIRMMNALSDGLMILVILLVSIVLVLIAMLCIRFTLLTQLEADRREIGAMKAIGIGRKQIRNIYFIKYVMLSGLGALAGLVLALVTESRVSVHMQELYGAPEKKALQLLAALIGAILTEGVLLLSVRRSLKRTDRLSAVEALAGWQNRKKEHDKTGSPQYLIVALVIGLGVFLMIVPQNLLSTVASPQFVTYMGIGDSEIRIDIRQTDGIEEQTERLEGMFSGDERISRHVALRTVSCRVGLSDGSCESLYVEQGDHTIFPVTYAKGDAPEKEGELALSWLCAEEWGLSVGDTVEISVKDKVSMYRICGIYSDITNGGKTAKAAVIPADEELMWSVFYVSLADNVSREQWLSECPGTLADAGISAKAVDIQKYVENTYGQTIREVRMAAVVALIVAVLVMFVVVVLFTRLLVAKDRKDISLRKAIGFSSGKVRDIYLVRFVPVAVGGILAGLLAGNLLGEKLMGILLRTLGATGFRFLIDAGMVFALIPFLAAVTVFLAVSIGLCEIKNVRAYECL
ncbi:MAG: FtsX-like permease family protein [Eubacterium sp.]|nr:FtsX-like permease family protein [Eubacterium sp.]